MASNMRQRGDACVLVKQSGGLGHNEDSIPEAQRDSTPSVAEAVTALACSGHCNREVRVEGVEMDLHQGARWGEAPGEEAPNDQMTRAACKNPDLCPEQVCFYDLV